MLTFEIDGLGPKNRELSDLLQQGRHRVFGKESQKGVFAKADSLEFWMGMVTLYMIGLHERAAAAYDEQMRSFAKEGEFHAAPGVKKFGEWGGGVLVGAAGAAAVTVAI